MSNNTPVFVCHADRVYTDAALEEFARRHKLAMSRVEVIHADIAPSVAYGYALRHGVLRLACLHCNALAAFDKSEVSA